MFDKSRKTNKIVKLRKTFDGILWRVRTYCRSSFNQKMQPPPPFCITPQVYKITPKGQVSTNK